MAEVDQTKTSRPRRRRTFKLVHTLVRRFTIDQHILPKNHCSNKVGSKIGADEEDQEYESYPCSTVVDLPHSSTENDTLAYQAFLSQYPAYATTSRLDAMREKSFSRIADNVYVDY